MQCVLLFLVLTVVIESQPTNVHSHNFFLSFSSFSLSSFHACQIPNGGPVIILTCRTPIEEPTAIVMCMKVMNKMARKAKIKLVTACLITLVFMIGEVIGEEVAVWNIIVVYPAFSLVRL